MWRETADPTTEANVSQERVFGDKPFQIMARGVKGCQVVSNFTVISYPRGRVETIKAH